MVKKVLFLAFVFFSVFASLVSAGTFKVNSIEVPQFLEPNSEYPITVQVEGIDWAGTTVVKTTSNAGYVYPSSQNFQIREGTNTLTFNLKTPNSEIIGEFSVEVCSVSEFTAPYCETKSETFSVVKRQQTQSSSLSISWIIIIILTILVLVFGFLYFKKKKN